MWEAEGAPETKPSFADPLDTDLDSLLTDISRDVHEALTS
jgi:hypothetical protein